MMITVDCSVFAASVNCLWQSVKLLMISKDGELHVFVTSCCNNIACLSYISRLNWKLSDWKHQDEVGRMEWPFLVTAGKRQIAAFVFNTLLAGCQLCETFSQNALHF